MSNGDGRTGGSKSSDGSPALSRNATLSQTPEFYEFGPFRLEPNERRLRREDEIVALTPKAFDTLHLLVKNSGHLLEKDELIGMLWPDTFVEEGSLSNNVFLLRKALGDNPEYIETVPGRGYRFIGSVRQLTKAVSASLKGGLEVGSQPGLPMTVAARRRLRERGAWAVLTVVALALGIGYVQRAPKPLLPIQFTIESPTKEPFGYRIPLSVSPDGKKLAFVQNDETQMPWVWVRGIGLSEPLKLEATAGVTGLTAWAADSNSLFFSMHDPVRNVARLKRVPISGGSAEIA